MDQIVAPSPRATLRAPLVNVDHVRHYYGDGDVLVPVRLTNTGTRAGTEVVQCYLEPVDPAAVPERPRRWLAGWAVVLAAFGLSRPTFPASAVAQRGVMLISFVLMVAAIATAILTSR